MCAEEKYLRQGSEAVGVEKNFYTLEKLDDPYCWEKFYATGIEPFMADTFSRVCSKCNLFVLNRTPVIDAELKSALALIMTVQFFEANTVENMNGIYIRGIAIS